MPCPFRHEGEQEPERSSEPGTPFDWIKHWYLRDINISRRVGWEGPTHDAFVAPFEAAYRFAQTRWPEKGGQPHMANDVFQEVLQEFGRRTGTYEPRDAKGDAPGGGLERPFEAFWPPVEDKSFEGLYPPVDAIGEDREQRPYRMFWEEAAIAETVKPFGSLKTPSIANDPTRSGIPEVNVSPPRGFAGGGLIMDMSEMFGQALDLITPSFRQADPEL